MYALVARDDYGPYGAPTRHSGEREPFGYAGQYTDSESGLQYLRARCYPTPSGLAPISGQAGGSPFGGIPSVPGEIPLPTPGQLLAGAAGLAGVGALAAAAADDREEGEEPIRVTGPTPGGDDAAEGEDDGATSNPPTGPPEPPRPPRRPGLQGPSANYVRLGSP